MRSRFQDLIRPPGCLLLVIVTGSLPGCWSFRIVAGTAYCRREASGQSTTEQHVNSECASAFDCAGGAGAAEGAGRLLRQQEEPAAAQAAGSLPARPPWGGSAGEQKLTRLAIWHLAATWCKLVASVRAEATCTFWAAALEALKAGVCSQEGMPQQQLGILPAGAAGCFDAGRLGADAVPVHRGAGTAGHHAPAAQGARLPSADGKCACLQSSLQRSNADQTSWPLPRH